MYDECMLCLTSQKGVYLLNIVLIYNSVIHRETDKRCRDGWVGILCTTEAENDGSKTGVNR